MISRTEWLSDVHRIAEDFQLSNSQKSELSAYALAYMQYTTALLGGTHCGRTLAQLVLDQSEEAALKHGITDEMLNALVDLLYPDEEASNS